MSKRLIGLILGTAIGLTFYHLVNPLRTEHMVSYALWFGLIAIPKTRFIGLVITPAFLFSLAYDSLRVFAESAAERVSVTLVPSWEQAIFGFMPPEAIEAIYHPVLHIFGGAVYTSHVIVVGAMAIFMLAKARGRYGPEDPEWRDYFHAFFWGFLLMNLLANLTQLAWPVAPPWYIDLYGPVMPGEPIPGNAAGLLITDELLGIKYFTNAYAVSSYTFGAMPSLHVAMPAWVALHLRQRWARALGWIFTAIMAFYAVYLNHHFVLDLVAGVGLAIGVYWAVHRGPLAGVPTRMHQFLSGAFEKAPAWSSACQTQPAASE